MWKYVVLLFIIIIFLLIFFIVLGLITYFSKPTTTQTDGAAVYQSTISPDTWGATVNVSPCGLYQFEGGTITIGSNTYQYPPTPSYSYDQISLLTPTFTIPTCLDEDQLIAQEINQTCLGPGGSTGATGATGSSNCYLESGVLVPPGTQENYFTNLYCTPVPACNGSLSLISVGFSANPSSDQCFVKTGPNLFYTSPGGCNVGSENQIFRVITQSGESSTNNTLVTTGNNTVGPLAQFYDRDSGLCAMPSSITIGAQLVLSACPTNPPWALIPSFTFEGATGFTGYVGYTGGTGYTGNISAPQQIAYVENIDITLIPPFGTIEFAEFIVVNNIYTIYNDFTFPYPYLKPYYFYTDTTTPNGQSDAQYFGIMNYNTLNSVPLCSSTVPPPCSSF